MSTHFVKKELKKITYNSPIDVVDLFKKENISYTLNHVFGSFLDVYTESEELKNDYAPHAIYFETSKIVNMEYTFLTDRLAELTDEPLMLAIDFKMDFESTRWQEFLVVSVLEDALRLVKMNHRKMMTGGRPSITYSPSFARSLIVCHYSFNEEGERFIQMNAVSFTLSGLEAFLDNEIFEALKFNFSNMVAHQVGGIFGRKQCGAFWKENKKNLLSFNENRI